MKKILFHLLLLTISISSYGQITISKIELNENENFILGTDVSVSQTIKIDTLIMRVGSTLGISKNISDLKIISDYVIIEDAVISANWERKGANGEDYSTSGESKNRCGDGGRGVKGNIGDVGGNGIKLSFDFDIESITGLTIYNSGGDGGRGGDGQNGGNGGRAWCKGNCRGGNGGRGGDGGNGGDGGDGGNVTIYYTYNSNITKEQVEQFNFVPPINIINNGGYQGAPGNGGRGGYGGAGKTNCGTWPARWSKGGGRKGSAGKKGVKGRKGNSGIKEIYFGDSPN